MAATALALLLPGPPVQADARSAAAGIALHRSDLPKGYTQVLSQINTNAQLAQQSGLSLATLNTRGRITGYVTAFRDAQGKSVIVVQDRVGAYKTSAGALWGYLIQGSGLMAAGYARLALPKVGVGSAAFSMTSAGKQSTAMVIHDRAYAVLLQIDASGGASTKKLLLSLARKIDERIKSA